jgi:hypothetical protein
MRFYGGWAFLLKSDIWFDAKDFKIKQQKESEAQLMHINERIYLEVLNTTCVNIT